MTIKLKKLDPRAVMPVKAHANDAGFDLTCTRITTELNECGQVVLVYHTDIAIEIPDGYFALMVPRSSIYKKSIRFTNCAGTIDSNYRGEVMGKFMTTTDVVPAVFKEGERFAQLLILPVPDVQFEEAETLMVVQAMDLQMDRAHQRDLLVIRNRKASLLTSRPQMKVAARHKAALSRHNNNVIKAWWSGVHGMAMLQCDRGLNRSPITVYKYMIKFS